MATPKKVPKWPTGDPDDNLGTDPDPVPPRPPPGKAPVTGRIPSGLPLPVDHGFSAEYLLNDQRDPKDALDVQWRRYALNPKRPGPRVSDDARPVARKLNAFERWALEPYLIDEDLDSATIYNGVLVPEAREALKKPEVREQLKKAGIDVDHFKRGEVPTALTYGKRGAVTIWIPIFRPQLWRRWDIGLLAHELAHGAQLRMGGQTTDQLWELLRRHGYTNSPVEVQARWVQGGVLRGLDKRAAALPSPAVPETPPAAAPAAGEPNWGWALCLLLAYMTHGRR